MKAMTHPFVACLLSVVLGPIACGGADHEPDYITPITTSRSSEEPADASSPVVVATSTESDEPEPEPATKVEAPTPVDECSPNSFCLYEDGNFEHLLLRVDGSSIGESFGEALNDLRDRVSSVKNRTTRDICLINEKFGGAFDRVKIPGNTEYASIGKFNDRADSISTCNWWITP